MNGNIYLVEAGDDSIRQISQIPGAAPSSSQGWRTSTVAGTGSAGAVDGSGNLASFKLALSHHER